MAGTTRIDRSIAAHDPDLAQTIEDLAPAAWRLGNAELDLVRLRRAEEQEGVPAAIARIAALKDTIKARAERLHIKPASGLRLIIDEHERFRRTKGRKPNMEQLTAAVGVASEILARGSLEADASAAAADHAARAARHLAGSSANALEYLQASA